MLTIAGLASNSKFKLSLLFPPAFVPIVEKKSLIVLLTKVGSFVILLPIFSSIGFFFWEILLLNMISLTVFHVSLGFDRLCSSWYELKAL